MFRGASVKFSERFFNGAHGPRGARARGGDVFEAPRKHIYIYIYTHNVCLHTWTSLAGSRSLPESFEVVSLVVRLSCVAPLLVPILKGIEIYTEY